MNKLAEYGIVKQSNPLLVQFKGSGTGVPVARNPDVATYPVEATVFVQRVSPGDPGVAICIVVMDP